MGNVVGSNHMEYTGERMVPEKAEATVFWEHVYRYRFACERVQGRAVLDIACGEGYGSALLKKAGAQNVIGVDISPDACAHARTRYGIDARVGSAERIPLETESVDTVVSFETIEHVGDPEQFIRECKRVLRPNGSLIISTPDRDAYKIVTPDNPFHCSELAYQEFQRILQTYFKSIEYYYQRTLSAPFWSLRGLTSFNWATRRVRGVTRITDLLRGLACPHLRAKRLEAFRNDPSTVLELSPQKLSSPLDPYAVRPEGCPPQVSAIYRIAVANLAAAGNQ